MRTPTDPGNGNPRCRSRLRRETGRPCTHPPLYVWLLNKTTTQILSCGGIRPPTEEGLGQCSFVIYQVLSSFPTKIIEDRC